MNESRIRAYEILTTVLIVTILVVIIITNMGEKTHGFKREDESVISQGVDY